MTALLDLRDVHAAYGQIEVLHGLSMHVESHESVGLLGPNGHGKTTLLRTVSNLHRASAGHLMFSDIDLRSTSARAIIEAGLVHVSQGNPLFPDLTIAETLALGAYSRRARAEERRTREEVLDLFPQVAKRQSQLCGTLSGGERQMVAIAVGLMARPRLLMLDEPTLGLSPKVKDELFDRIAQIRELGTSLIVVDGDVEFVTGLTDRWYLVELGRVALESSSLDQAKSHELVESYFSGVSVTGAEEAS